MTILQEIILPNIADIQLSEGVSDSSGKKSFYMKGIFIQGDVKNHNGRVYPKNEVEKAIKSLNDRMRAGLSILGEVDHPQNLTINLDRVSHVITEMRLDGANGVGTLKIIDKLPQGQICKAFLEEGIKLGVSSRGTGEVDSNGYVKNFDIVTIDIVAQPSAPDAYPKAIMEALEHYRKRNEIIDLATSVEYDPRAEKHLVKSIKNFIDSL